MTEITSRIESIRNMKEDLLSIKKVSQKNTEQMFQDLAHFRNKISHDMSNIESKYKCGTTPKRKDKKKNQIENYENLSLNSEPEDHGTSQPVDSDPKLNQMSFILHEIENVQKKSKKMLIELENYSEPVTSLSNIGISSQLNINENYTSTSETSFNSPVDMVNVIFSKELPYDANSSTSNQTLDEAKNISSLSVESTKHHNNKSNINFENDILTKEKIGTLSKKLKEIQKQNDELKNVNDNIQNLLMKLNDLKYMDEETLEELKAVKNESKMFRTDELPQIDSVNGRHMKNESFEDNFQSIQITSKCKLLTILIFQTKDYFS